MYTLGYGNWWIEPVKRSGYIENITVQTLWKFVGLVLIIFRQTNKILYYNNVGRQVYVYTGKTLLRCLCYRLEKCGHLELGTICVHNLCVLMWFINTSRDLRWRDILTSCLPLRRVTLRNSVNICFSVRHSLVALIV